MAEFLSSIRRHRGKVTGLQDLREAIWLSSFQSDGLHRAKVAKCLSSIGPHGDNDQDLWHDVVLEKKTHLV